MSKEIQEEIYRNGDEWIDGISQAIAKAQEYIYFESYIFNNDSTGRMVLDLLKQAAKRGVKVHVIVDGIGAPSWNAKKIAGLALEKVEMRVYHPPPWVLKEPWFIKYFQIRSLLEIFGRLNKRNHRKTLIVDGKLVIIGSINVADCHLSRISGNNSWRDTAVKVFNNDIQKICKSFEYTWKYSWHGKWLWRLQLSEPLQLSEFFAIRGSFLSRMFYYRLILKHVYKAKSKIYITNPYFVPHARLLIALKNAARRGVDVKVIVPMKIDIPIVKWASLSFYKEMLSSGIRIFEYKPHILHAKTMIIDEWAMVGSSNLNNRSFMHDLELDAFLHTEIAQKRLLDLFQDDLGQSQEIKIKDLGKRNIFGKMLSYFAIALRYWL